MVFYDTAAGSQYAFPTTKYTSQRLRRYCGCIFNDTPFEISQYRPVILLQLVLSRSPIGCKSSLFDLSQYFTTMSL